MPDADRAAALEIRRLEPAWAQGLADLFADLGPDEPDFHPHPLTAAEARRLCTLQGQDLYYVAVEGARVLGYGMLRGWDEGFDVPSLGIALHPSARRTGLARCLMEFLHAAAARRGASTVRLKVAETNVVARRLYERLGYVFDAPLSGELVGRLDLAAR